MKRFMMTMAALAMLWTCSARQAAADNIAVTFDDPTGQTLGNGPFTLGWKFTVNSSINVTKLGVFDDSQDGLGASHAIGIWDSVGNLVATATVSAGTVDPLTNQFRYVAVSPVTLTAGVYDIGALWLDGTDNNIFPGGATNFATDPAITFNLNAFVAGNTLADPIFNGDSTPAYFGPNFQFESAAVPEPATLTMLGFGMVSLVGYGLRRRKQAVA